MILKQRARKVHLSQMRDASQYLGNLFRKNLDHSKSPKSTNVALGKMSGSEGKHGQTAEHGQYFVLPVREYPAVTL